MKKFPRANKELGQHFLVNPKVISSICEKPKDLKLDTIIEVGPGPAVLSPHLASLDLPLFLIEKDDRFKEQLIQHVQSESIFFQDALEFNIDQFAKDKNFESIWLVSNLPYNVSVPLTLKFFKSESIKVMTLMYQKEVGAKFVPAEHTKNSMNSLYFLTQTYFESQVVCKVPPGSFVPPPQVDSLVLRFERKNDPEIPLSQFNKIEKFLRTIFSEKRKQLQKLLKKAYPPEAVKKSLEFSNIEYTARAESLNYQQIKKLYEKITTC